MIREEKAIPKRNFAPLRLCEIRKISAENQALRLGAFAAK